MKIAVICHNNLGLEFVHYLCSIGADVVLFYNQTTPENAVPGHQWTPQLKNQDCTLFHNKILWIQKKAISKIDYNGKERMKDLFRIVFEIQPEVTSSDNQTYSNEFKESLEQKYDSFIDVDGVVDLEDSFFDFKLSHPSGAPALGELKLKHLNQINYETQMNAIELPALGEIAILGCSITGNASIKKIFQWVLEKNKTDRRVFWITHQPNPWTEIVDEELLSLKEQLDQQYAIQVENFLEKIATWQDLEDYEKVKISKPQEPIPLLVVFAGHHSSAIDSLLNIKKLYLTIEKSNLHTATIQIENTHREIKTLSVDQVYIFNGHQFQSNWKKYLLDDEPGYLSYYTQELTLRNIITDFEKRFLIYFQKV